MTVRRRFFPVKRVQTAPGKKVELEVQVRPENDLIPCGDPEFPRWVGYFDHNGAPMTHLKIDKETRTDMGPTAEIFVAHCPGVSDVQWRCSFSPMLLASARGDAGDELFEHELDAVDLHDLPQVNQEENLEIKPTDRDYPSALNAVAYAGGAVPTAYRLADPFLREPITESILLPGWFSPLDFEQTPWVVIPAGNTCTVMCDHSGEFHSPRRWSANLVLSAEYEGAIVGSVELLVKFWEFY